MSFPIIKPFAGYSLWFNGAMKYFSWSEDLPPKPYVLI
jgi:hypothetical protein